MSAAQCQQVLAAQGDAGTAALALQAAPEPAFKRPRVEPLAIQDEFPDSASDSEAPPLPPPPTPPAGASVPHDVTPLSSPSDTSSSSESTSSSSTPTDGSNSSDSTPPDDEFPEASDESDAEVPRCILGQRTHIEQHKNAKDRGIRVWCCEAAHGASCRLFRSVHIDQDIFGPRAAALFLETWLARAREGHGRPHRSWRPSRADVRAYAASREP